MRKTLLRCLVLALPVSILAACGSDRESASPVDATLELAGVANDCPSGDISQDIAAIFPTKKSLRHVATVNCGQIFKDFGKGKQAEAVQKAVRFFEKTLQQYEKGQLIDHEGLEDDLADLFTAIFAGIGSPLGEIPPEALASGEYAIGTLSPGGPPKVTVSGHAGIDDGGGLFGPVDVVVFQIFPENGGGGLGLASESHPCPAGVDGSFDCYPLFFDYSVFPESNVNPAVGLQLGQCNVSPSGVEVQLLSPEGFLPDDDAPNGVVCDDVQPEEVAMTGWRKYAWAVLEPMSPLLRVTPAIAGKNPVGGRISSFSPVAPADPTSGGEQTFGSVAGQVTNSSDDSPIQGATVELLEAGDAVAGSTTTNTDGNYAFTGIELGSYRVRASATGFDPDVSAPFDLTLEAPDLAGVDIALAASENPPPPPPGTDIVVFNDVNVFDNTGMSDSDNVVLVQNLVDFTTSRPRNAGTEVWVDCRSSVTTGAHGGCQNPSTFRSTIEGQDLTLVDVFDGSLDELPPEVKVLFLWIPTEPYPASEVNAFKRFAAEGGRVIFVGENAGFYGCCFALQNDLLEAFGATLRNSGGVFHAGYFQLPQSSLRPHQITTGVVTLTIAASSEIVLGPGDFALYYDATETHVLSGVATIDTLPIPEQPAASRSIRIQGVPTPTLDTIGRPIARDR